MNQMNTDTAMELDEMGIEYEVFSPEKITSLINELPEQVTTAQLAELVGVNIRRFEKERSRGCAPVPTGKRGSTLLYDREAVRGWITDRLTATEQRLQIDGANIGRLISQYGDCHVSDYYIHGHAPYMYPVVFKPAPEVWPEILAA